MTTIRTVVQRASLTAAVHRRLDEFLRQQTVLYNAALEERIAAYRLKGKTITLYDQIKSLTEIRGFDPEFAKFSLHPQRSTLITLDRSFQGFFRRVKTGKKPGFPRFKSTRRGIRSFSVPDPRIRRRGAGHAFHIKGIGRLGFKRLPPGKVKMARVVRSALRVSVHLVMEQEIQPRTPEELIGIDMGITNRATLSTGEKIPKAKPDRRRLTRKQRAVSRAQKKSRSRAKKVLELQKEHERVTTGERNALHRVTTEIVKKHNRISVEDLQIQNMVRNRNLARSIIEQQWRRFTEQLSYKAESAGGEVVKVDPKRTSMTCHVCGTIKEMPLHVREYACDECGQRCDRDLNAALVVCQRGNAQAGRAIGPPARPCASADHVQQQAAGLPGLDAEQLPKGPDGSKSMQCPISSPAQVSPP